MVMKTEKILIVNDSQFFIQMIKSTLKRPGCDILTAGGGSEALDIIKSNSPNLILMDFYIKGMNGAECCKKIKSNPATKGIPVIMITFAGKNEDIENCNNAGCDDYVTRPVEKMVLLKKVNKYLAISVREHKRASICVPALYYFDNEEYSGIVFSIGEGGMYIKGERVLDKGSCVKANFDIAHIAKQIEVEGEVVWNTEEIKQVPLNIGHGFGVKFTSIDQKGIEAIKEYINIGNYLV